MRSGHAAGHSEGLKTAEGLKTTPYWWEAARPQSTPEAPLPERVDVAIVGSGYCGLSAAIELSAAGRSVVVLDAGELGIGASTRSGGMVTGGQKFVVSGALKSHVPARQQRILEDAKASLDHIEELIQRHSLEADYVRCGRLILAWTPGHYARLQGWAKLLETYAPGTIELVPRAQLWNEIGSERFFGGLLVKNYGGLHPAKYHRALRNLAHSSGANLVSSTPVIRIERRDGDHLVVTKRGRIAARSVFVATNGYSADAEPFLKSRVIGAASYIIATEPLAPDLARKLSPRGRMFSDTRASLCYFRLSPDGTRVIFGGRATARELDEGRAAAGLFGKMCEIWPELAGVGISHCWRGNFGMTYDHIPHMGTHDGVHYAVGCNGSGVTMMTYLGHQTALKILGRQNRPCAFDVDEFAQVPLAWARSWTVPAVTSYYLARDWIEGRLAAWSR
ncbi:MAG TPA: FAD-binding oxidoreductase [Hyphomicrobiaceae bacterium]|nr:FAD-binding oxidoreductase [Hyphomicrobiaceae bacterium]